MDAAVIRNDHASAPAGQRGITETPALARLCGPSGAVGGSRNAGFVCALVRPGGSPGVWSTAQVTEECQRSADMRRQVPVTAWAGSRPTGEL
jgi:hypothetical protein